MPDLPRWPAMFFKPDENGDMQSTIFDEPAEVPPGWMHSPDCFDENGEVKEGMEADIPGLEDVDVAEEPEGDESGEYADYNEITVDELKAYLSENEVTFESGANKAALYKLYVTHFTGEEGAE